MDQDLLPAAIAARKVGVSRQLLYTWVKRDLLKPADRTEDGRPLYSLRRVLEVERRTRRSGVSHRGPRVA